MLLLLAGTAIATIARGPTGINGEDGVQGLRGPSLSCWAFWATSLVAAAELSSAMLSAKPLAWLQESPALAAAAVPAVSPASLAWQEPPAATALTVGRCLCVDKPSLPRKIQPFFEFVLLPSFSTPCAPQGVTGDVGAPGYKGHDGHVGVNGAVGPNGFPGPQGPGGGGGGTGEAGQDGQPGENGVDGSNGNKGMQGPVGATGPGGERGAAGADGTDGNDGATGLRGAPGAPGAPGEDAFGTGINGMDGNPGTDGTDGGPGGTGPQGFPGTHIHTLSVPVPRQAGSFDPASSKHVTRIAAAEPLSVQARCGSISKNCHL